MCRREYRREVITSVRLSNVRGLVTISHSIGHRYPDDDYAINTTAADLLSFAPGAAVELQHHSRSK